jgi:hypothetical protein
VVYLDLSVESDSPETLEKSLMSRLLTIGRREKLKISAPTSNDLLYNLIEALSDKYETRVVVLIDEYDTPVSDNLGNTDLAKANQMVLKNFYSKLKSCDEYLRFLFVTGVTRYSFMGVTSGLNQLTNNQLADLTLNRKFTGVCGFTINEFEDYFGEWLSIALQSFKDKGCMSPDSTPSELYKWILYWYDGYSWEG